MNVLLITFGDTFGVWDYNVYYDSSDPTLITYLQFPHDPSGPSYPSYNDGEIIGSPNCQGTTLTTYRFSSLVPYAIYSVEYNSPTCGYVPDLCDLALSTLTHTDETNTGANDGTIQAFGTSTALPIAYQLVGHGPANSTGYFTDLAPGTYELLMGDQRGCSVRFNFVTILPFDTTKTRCKYQLAFLSLKNGINYTLKFLYQKAQFDPLVYPLNLTGTDTPVLYKTINSNEDKTEAFAPSSLTINLLVNNIFQVSEFANAQERDWKIELYKRKVVTLPPSAFASTLDEQTSPEFIDGNVQLKNNGNVVYRQTTSGTESETIPVGLPYSIEAFCQATPVGDPNARMRLTILRGSKIIYDKQIVAEAGASMVKTGIVQNETYTITCRTWTSFIVVPVIDIDDNADPFLTLDWQGWLLPDELQDFYADPNYAISMIATDGLLSLKGGSFGDLSKFYIDAQGIKHLYQLFGLTQWGYLVKICLDQLGYNYGTPTILSSLTYVPVDNNWINYSTWADLFYDTNGVPDDTYSALEILLKGMHLQIFQQNGKFVLWDINDVFYRNSSPAQLQTYCFETDLISTLTPGVLPSNLPIGANQINKPINPLQTLNYDKAFNQIEGDVSFNLLSLLYPNPSFELNAVQGAVPEFLSQTGGMNAFSDYQPQDPLDPNVGAFTGNWVMRNIGATEFLKDGFGVPIVQSGNILFERTDYNWVHATDDFIIDQSNKRLNVSFYWRPVKYSDSENVVPRISIFYTDNNTGVLWFYSIYDKGGYNNTGWYPPAHPFAFNVVGVPGGSRITDYLAWNNFSITTDPFPESGIGHVAVGIGTPIVEGSIGDMAFNGIIDYDNWMITQSDANDAYNFQTGENHIVTNVTTYAKSEKKTVDLSLFTFPGNKRLSGNISYGDVYSTSKITNEWKFALSVEQFADRLPANIIRRFAKNYQRPMYKLQSDISSDAATYYAIWVLNGYPNKVFVAFTIEMDLRNSIGNVVLIEIDDSQMQSFYQYVPVYSKSARNNTG